MVAPRSYRLSVMSGSGGESIADRVRSCATPASSDQGNFIS